MAIRLLLWPGLLLFPGKSGQKPLVPSLAKLGKASQAFDWATDAKEEEKNSKSYDCADLH